jgi:hypothetical protein
MLRLADAVGCLMKPILCSDRFPPVLGATAYRRKNRFDMLTARDIQLHKSPRQACGSQIVPRQFEPARGVTLGNHRHLLDPRNNFIQQFQSLGGQVGSLIRDASDVCARSSERRDEPRANRVTATGKKIAIVSVTRFAARAASVHR